MSEADSHESTERKENRTLALQRYPEMHVVLDEEANSSMNDEPSTSTGMLRYNWPFQKFTGAESRKEAQEWLNRINYFAKINGWPNEEKLSVALRHLTGSARRRWFLQLDVPTTWTNFQRHFYETYIVSEPAVQKWERMFQRQQKESELTLTYFGNKLSLCIAAGLTSDQTEEQILISLRSNETNLQCAGWSHVQGNDLLKGILQIERMNDLKRNIHCDIQRQLGERRIRQEVVSEYLIPVSNRDVTPACFEKIKNVSFLSMLKNIFRCHGRRSSPETRIDTKHFMKVSALCQPTADWAAAIVKMVIVNGRMKVIGLIDHGSSDCLMRKSVALAGGWLPRLRNSEGAIIIGNMVFVKELIYVYLTIDGVGARVVPLLVVPDDALPYPLMVGRTWMEQRCIGYIRDEDGFRFFYLTNAQGLIDTPV